MKVDRETETGFDISAIGDLLLESVEAIDK